MYEKFIIKGERKSERLKKKKTRDRNKKRGREEKEKHEERKSRHRINPYFPDTYHLSQSLIKA